MMERMPVGRLLEHMLRELEMSSTVFSVTPGFRGGQRGVPTPEGRAESALGVAAGPHTRTGQALAAGYVAGARVFEIPAPWTEDGPSPKLQVELGNSALHVSGAGRWDRQTCRDETVKGCFLIRLLSRELGLGDPGGAVFLLDVAGAKETLAGAYTSYLDDLADASRLEVWGECVDAALSHLDLANNLDREYVESVSPKISRWVSLSPQPGDTPEELLAAGRALLDSGHSLALKLNGSFLDKEEARAILAAQGDGYEMDEARFGLSWPQAMEAARAFRKYAGERGLSFGLNLSGTLPVAGGRWLTGPAATAAGLILAEKAAWELPQTAIAFAGGADAFNVGALTAAGLSPVLAETTLLKPGGFHRLKQMSRTAVAVDAPAFPDGSQLATLARKGREDARSGAGTAFPWKKLPGKAPMMDCFTAPCAGGCPFGLDVTGYLRLMSDGRFRDALRVILDRDPLPNITGAICPAPCENHCTRLFYDEAIDIRGSEGYCAQAAWQDLLPRLEPAPPLIGQRVAVIGGGPAGMAAAFLLARRGAPVTVFEKEDKLGGAVRRYIPEFRVSQRDVDRDCQLLRLMGVDVRLGVEAPAADKVRQMGYSHVLVAIGASVPALAALEGQQPVDALTYLARCKEDAEAFPHQGPVVVLGDGDTAMDAARVALRRYGAERVTVVCARDASHMKAQKVNYEAVLREGGEFLFGYRAVAWDGEKATLEEVRRGESVKKSAAGGAASDDEAAPSEEKRAVQRVERPAGLVIAALGAAVDGGILTRHGATLDSRGLPVVSDTLETSAKKVYVLGDALRGPGNVAQAIADAHRVVDAILGVAPPYPHTAGRRGSAMGKKGKLARRGDVAAECERCLGCSTVCEGCVDVCPNRANLPISVPTRRKPQILHLDALCQGCGVCAGACPFESAPYLEKFTLFETIEDFESSENSGFVVVDFLSRKVRVRLLGRVQDVSLRRVESDLPSEARELMETIFIDYPYLLDPLRRKQEEQLKLWE